MTHMPDCNHTMEPRYDEVPVCMVMDWSRADSSVPYHIAYKKVWCADVCTRCGFTCPAQRRA